MWAAASPPRRGNARRVSAPASDNREFTDCLATTIHCNFLPHTLHHLSVCELRAFKKSFDIKHATHRHFAVVIVLTYFYYAVGDVTNSYSIIDRAHKLQKDLL